MTVTAVTNFSERLRIDFRMVLAFGAIYVLWGATFLAIRIAVLQIPPFFTAGIRFFTAGILLHAFMRFRGAARLSLIEWRNTALIGSLMFVATYGPLFWAEQYVSSSITAVIEASLPITTITLEVLVFRSQRLQWRVLAGVALGFLGILLLLVHNGAQHLAAIPCLVILAAGVAWSLGAVLSGRIALPRSRPLTAGTQMMLGGAVLLIMSAATGEMHPFPRITLSAGLSLLYLIVCGSLIAYSAYVWLLGRTSATRVASHAYVNPVIAVALGYFAAGEIITVRTVIASAFVVGSVFLILWKGTPRAARPHALRTEAILDDCKSRLESRLLISHDSAPRSIKFGMNRFWIASRRTFALPTSRR